MSAGTKLRGLLGRKPADTGRDLQGRCRPVPVVPVPVVAGPAAPSPDQVPGGQADTPTQIPAQGWKQVLLRTKQQIKEDNIPLLAAGVAFYAFIALFPALIAAVTVYGLVSDPEQVEEQIGGFADTLPREAASLLTDQLTSIAGGSSSALGWGLLLSLGGALFAASGGMQNLIKAVNIAYDEEETRGFVKLRGARAGAHAGRDRLHRGHRRPHHRPAGTARRARSRRPLRRAGRPVGRAGRLRPGGPRRHLPLRPRPRRPEVPLGRARQRRRDAAVDHRVGRASRSTSATSASTARRTARSRASSSCCCGSG